MREFKTYKRKKTSEMVEVNESDIIEFLKYGKISVPPNDLGDWKHLNKVSISDEDLKKGSPKIGDMIARNPKNYNDQWLVAKDYFEDNFELLSSNKTKK